MIAGGKPFDHRERPQDRCRGIGRHDTVIREDDICHYSVVQDLFVATEVVVRNEFAGAHVEVFLDDLFQGVQCGVVRLRSRGGEL